PPDAPSDYPLVSMPPSEPLLGADPAPGRNRSASEYATPFPRAIPDPPGCGAEGSARTSFGRPHYQLDGPHHFVKSAGLGFQLLLPGGGQGVKTGLAVILRDAPFGLHPAFMQHP